MSDRQTLSVAGMFADRDARRRREREAEEQLRRKQDEELAAFKKRLDEFQLTQHGIDLAMEKIRRAFDRGETELMFASFPSSFCTDDGRSVLNAGAPPIVKPDKNAPKPEVPDWINTMPKGARVVYDYWKANMEPGGFKLSARVINFPDGKPGDVGLFFSWPKDLSGEG
ncbi:MAG: hypothetical protein JSS43_01215 [Proteobacteria bacterium]|nr:hypothetical protein [Pseudomonadota bacterium]